MPITTPEAMVTVGFAELINGGAASTVEKASKQAIAVKSVVVYMILVGAALLRRYTQAIKKQSNHKQYSYITYTSRGALLIDASTALIPGMQDAKKRLV